MVVGPANDKAMLKAAADLTRELNRPNAAVSWADMIASAGISGPAKIMPSIRRSRTKRKSSGASRTSRVSVAMVT